jgi:RNA polymerase sigma-70 factor (ECF subfamily)
MRPVQQPINGGRKPANPVEARILAGQAHGFEDLFAEHRSMVYAIGLRILGTHEDAEDITQDVFTKVWKNFGAFNNASSLKTWIYRIAVNTSIDHGRKPWKKLNLKATHITIEGEDSPEDALLVDPETAEGRLLAREKVVTLEKAIGSLRPHLKDVFVLKELEEMSYDEISSVLGLSMGTISSRLNRARKALQESLRVFTGTRGFAGAPA